MAGPLDQLFLTWCDCGHWVLFLPVGCLAQTWTYTQGEQTWCFLTMKMRLPSPRPTLAAPSGPTTGFTLVSEQKRRRMNLTSQLSAVGVVFVFYFDPLPAKKCLWAWDFPAVWQFSWKKKTISAAKASIGANYTIHRS